MNFIRTDSKNPDFIDLVRQLDADLAVRDGDEHAFYAQFNTIQSLGHCVVAYLDQVILPTGCGAIKEFDVQSMEVKRMYVPPLQRGRGIASVLLNELEKWASEMGYRRCVLETGKRQPEAIALYSKNGYQQIPNFGQYIGVENSVCFEKVLGE
jgi:GNAT superfamily N-acetyltransferase